MCGTLSENDNWIAFLYGRSGNRCAICCTSLFLNSSTDDDNSERFEHIIDNSVNEPQDRKHLNLILLCKKCRVFVKIWSEHYTPKVLTSIKKNHELMVSNLLSNK